LPGWSKIGHLPMFRVIAGVYSSKIAARSSGLKLWPIAPLNLVGMQWLYSVVALIRSCTSARPGCCGK
jgi:hypothetical protein